MLRPRVLVLPSSTTQMSPWHSSASQYRFWTQNKVRNFFISRTPHDPRQFPIAFSTSTTTRESPTNLPLTTSQKPVEQKRGFKGGKAVIVLCGCAILCSSLYSQINKLRQSHAIRVAAAQKQVLEDNKTKKRYQEWRDSRSWNLLSCRKSVFDEKERALLDKTDLLRLCLIEAGMPADVVDAAIADRMGR
jgi:hypothetical protein